MNFNLNIIHFYDGFYMSGIRVIPKIIDSFLKFLHIFTFFWLFAILIVVKTFNKL